MLSVIRTLERFNPFLFPNLIPSLGESVMANLLSDKLQEVFKNLRGFGKLSESNVTDAVREVRLALLAADVNYQGAKELCDEIKQKALGEEVLKSIKPSEQFVKIFQIDGYVACLGVCTCKNAGKYSYQEDKCKEI